MKKITTLLIAGISIFAATQIMSCKKKDKDEATVVGTWKSQTLSYKITVNGVVEEDTTEAYTTSELTMNADKTYTVVDSEDSSSNDMGTYSIEGSKLYINSADGYKDTADFTVTSSQLTLSGSDTYTSGGTTTKSDYKTVYNKK